MHNFRVLNKKEIKHIQSVINRDWEAQLPDFIYLQNSEGRLYGATRDVFSLDHDLLRVDSVGIYMGRLVDEGLRLSPEGAQMLGPLAMKGILDIDDRVSFLRGEEQIVDHPDTGFLIIRCGKDFLGCGKVKAGKLYNYYPKTRMIG
jgi:NOL1/NOP2/fmu family ribosome biogenesis protein